MLAKISFPSAFGGCLSGAALLGELSPETIVISGYSLPSSGLKSNSKAFPRSQSTRGTGSSSVNGHLSEIRYFIHITKNNYLLAVLRPFR